MTSKSPVRSCEDVDEATLSFAEIKALCAGDPRIKERMDLDVEVSRLKIMKADHQSKQYRLEDNVLKHFPEQIQQAQGFIAGLTDDIQTLNQHPRLAEGFAGIEILGAAYADKAEAGTALLDAIQDVTDEEPVIIGSYRGFGLSVKFTGFTHKLSLKGAIAYNVELGTDARGNLVRIDNAYSRTQAEQGSFQPCYTVFQSREDFITLAQKENGGTAWRTAAFDNLGYSWDFQDKCAFYSAADETRLCRYFKSSPGSGFKPLLKAQAGIQERRRQERQRIREQEIVRRMECVPALPRGLKSWIHKSVMPAYFFYDYKRGGKDVSGVCSVCGHEIRLSGVKQGNKAVCPHCRHELIMKPRSRRGCCMTDRDTCQVIQNVGNGELVIRIVKVYYTYTDDTPEINIYENARQFIRQNGDDGKIDSECYYYQHGSGILTDWKKGERPALFSQWQYSFEADTCAHLYTRNLPDELNGTVWQYCPIDGYYSHFREQIQSLPFLAAYLKHPRLE